MNMTKISIQDALELARKNSNLKNYAAAKQIYRDIITAHPNNPAAHFEIAKIAKMQGLHEDFKLHLYQSLAYEANNLDHWCFGIETFIEFGQKAIAKTLLIQA